MTLRSPLGQARGLGSAKAGPATWWAERISSLALVPLTLWFVYSLVRFPLSDYATMIAWVRAPLVAVTLIVFLAVSFWHSVLGVTVVIEDYVAGEGLKFASLIVARFALYALGAVSIYAVLKIAFGAAA